MTAPNRRLRSFATAALVALAALPLGAHGSGVLVPRDLADDDPDAQLLLRKMDVRVVVDGPHASVRLEQIWDNRSDRLLEGTYEIALPPGATLSAFSIWEGERRLHGVVIEKQRGRRLYEELTSQNIDPGLVETGDDGNEGRLAVRVAPIPAWGTTRVEVIWEQTLPLASLGTQLVVPLAPAEHGTQHVGELVVDVEVRSPLPMDRAVLLPEAWFGTTKLDAGKKTLRARHAAHDVDLESDLSLRLGFVPPAPGVPGAPIAELWAYRDPSPPRDASPFAVAGAAPVPDEAGFFVVRAVLPAGGKPGAAPAARAPRDLVVVLDASPSMQGDKLEIAFAALEHALGQRLGPDDRFGVVVFNDAARAWKPALEPASAANVAAALAFVRASWIAGGTDLGAAVDAATPLLAGPAPAGRTRAIVLLSDGRPTRGTIDQRGVETQVTRALATAPGTRLFVLGVGEDGDDLLLGKLATASGGAYVRLDRRSDDSDLLRASFFDRLDGRALGELGVTLPAAVGAAQIYAPVQLWQGGDALIVGRYARPGRGTGTFFSRGPDGDAHRLGLAVDLPASDLTRPWIARLWATRRVTDLLDRIRVDGEREEWVGEIIRLAKRFRMVTPYTSFLAAPRALLRPRNFQAGDPILRVKTGPEIRSVVVIFPWGLEKRLEHVTDEDIWETRFLAPAWMKDGAYRCTLVLTDEHGRKLREDKRFNVDSTPPAVKVELSRGVVAPGAELVVTARADADVRTIVARVDDGPGADVRWDGQAKASRGTLTVPADLRPGRHAVHIVAEDFAKNTTVVTLWVEVREP